MTNGTEMTQIWQLSLALAHLEQQAPSHLTKSTVSFPSVFPFFGKRQSLIVRPEYFREAHGRVYPVDENLPLTYPVDDIETRRHQLQHIFVKALVHGNYVGPVQELLKPRSDGSRPRILDIRTCAGDWYAH